jgi:peptidyl-prolyl cis-trans isomerase B (cyclophilin B)
MTNTPATTDSTMSTSPLNTMALVGFILSVSGVATGITLIPGIVLSHIGMSQIKRTGESGRGFALAGLIVGYCVLGLSVLAGFFVLLFLVLIPLIAVGSLRHTNVS